MAWWQHHAFHFLLRYCIKCRLTKPFHILAKYNTMDSASNIATHLHFNWFLLIQQTIQEIDIANSPVAQHIFMYQDIHHTIVHCNITMQSIPFDNPCQHKSIWKQSFRKEGFALETAASCMTFCFQHHMYCKSFAIRQYFFTFFAIIGLLPITSHPCWDEHQCIHLLLSTTFKKSLGAKISVKSG